MLIGGRHRSDWSGGNRDGARVFVGEGEGRTEMICSGRPLTEVGDFYSFPTKFFERIIVLNELCDFILLQC